MANMGNRQQHSSNSRGNSGGSSNGRGAAAAVAVDSFGFVFGPRQSGPCGSLPLPLPLSASACQLKSDRAKKLARNIKAAATTTTRGSNWQLATGSNGKPFQCQGLSFGPGNKFKATNGGNRGSRDAPLGQGRAKYKKRFRS